MGFFKDASQTESTSDDEFLSTPAAVRQFNRTYNRTAQLGQPVPDTFSFVPHAGVTVKEYLDAKERFRATDLGAQWEENNNPGSTHYDTPLPPGKGLYYDLLYARQASPYGKPQYAFVTPTAQVPAHARLAMLRN